MAEQQYLSTDPNAGLSPEKRYLSTDPNAGRAPNAGEAPRKKTRADITDGMDPSEIMEIMAAEDNYAGRTLRAAMGGAALPVGGQPTVINPVVKYLGEQVSNRAVPLVRSALKPVWAEVRRRANVEGVLPARVADSIARFVAERQLRTPEQADALVKQLGSQIDDRLAEVSTPLDTAQRIPRYLEVLMRRVDRQALPRADRSAVQSAAREVVEDSPLSHEVVEQVQKTVPSAILDASGKPMTRTVVENIKKRALREDVTPSEGMDIARMTSTLSTKRAWGSEAGNAGAKAAEKTIERATRDAVKNRVPEVRPLLQQQGRAMDARTLLDRRAWRDANRDQINLGGLLGFANGNAILGAVLQAAKEQQFNAGLFAGKMGPKIVRNAQPIAEDLGLSIQAALSSLLNPTEPRE